MEIFVKNQSSGVEFVIKTREVCRIGTACVFEVFGVTATTRQTKNGYCLILSSSDSKTWKPVVEKLFKTKLNLRGAGLEIRLDDQSKQAVEEVKEMLTKQQEELVVLYNKEASEQPLQWIMYDFLDWGDYTINHEREIRGVRAPMKHWGEKYEVTEKNYRFWNKDIGNYEELWNEKIKALNEGKVTSSSSFAISEESVKFWINAYNDIQQEKAQKEAEKQQAKKRAGEKALAEREAKFYEAKETGKPVILSSCFLSNNDIPKQYRDDDSDMGHLITYAMPDGSTTEHFSHSY